jgi:hypothetical protein
MIIDDIRHLFLPPVREGLPDVHTHTDSALGQPWSLELFFGAILLTGMTIGMLMVANSADDVNRAEHAKLARA